MAHLHDPNDEHLDDFGEFDEFTGRVSRGGVAWLRENDPGRLMDLKQSRTKWVEVVSAMGDMYECLTRLGAVFHIPKEYVVLEE